MIKTAIRMEHLAPHFFATLSSQIADLTRKGKDVIRLDEGSPDLPPDPRIISALTAAALRADNHCYQPHRGTQALRTAWSKMYSRVHGVELDPETEVLPLLGSKEGIFHFAQAFINPGDTVLIPNPGYVTYTRSTLMAGGIPITIPLRPDRSFLPELSSIPSEVARKAKILWLNYPNNPTAAIATSEFFAEAVAFARDNNLILCHDSAYAQVTYDNYHAPCIFSIPGAKEVVVEFNSLSKSHNMAGWRVGAVVGNAEILRSFYTLKTNVDSGHFAPIQTAAVEAMTGDQTWLTQRNEIYQYRRDVLIAGLNKLGLSFSIPKASLYAWAQVPHGWNGASFSTHALKVAHVSLTPGIVFGSEGEDYIRISLTAPAERIHLAMERLTAVDWGKI